MKINAHLDDGKLRQLQRRIRRDTGLVTWKCDSCKKVDRWGPTWAWWGSIKDIEDCGTEAGAIRVACSDSCREKARAS